MNDEVYLDNQVANVADVPRDSLKKRYLFKVISNFVGLVSNIVVQAIAPRSLGPKDFGNFNFLTNFFAQILEMADGQSSVGALVKVSLRPKESGLVVFYLYFAALVTALVLAFVGCAHLLGLDQLIWPGQVEKFVVLGALWAILVWLHGVLHKLCDAFGHTRGAEWVRIQQKVLSIAALLAMFYLHVISLVTFFLYYLALLLYLFIGFAVVLIWNGRWPAAAQWKLPLVKIRGYLAEFYVYSSPLYVYVAAESMVAVLDRWVLQRYGGSQEQGYFGFAYQIGYISVLFVGAISPLIQREFSVAHASKNFTHMAYLFKRYMPMLFSIAAFFTGFIVFQSSHVIHVFAGRQFGASLWVITIMAFYPIYFTFGRVSSAVFYATGETQLFRNLGLAVQGFGLLLTWFLIAPHSIGGLGLGAVGLAIKLVIVQTILVNLQVFFSTRILRISFGENLKHQLLAIMTFLLLGALSTWVIDHSIHHVAHLQLVQFLSAGVLYCFIVAAFVYAFPALIGIYRSDFVQMLELVWRGMRLPVMKKVYQPQLRQVSQEVGTAEGPAKRRLKIAFLGAQDSIHTVRWVNAMAERGHEIHMITMHPKGSDQFAAGVQVHRLRFSAPWGYILNIFRLRRILKKLGPDVIHVHYASGYGTLASFSTEQAYILSAWGSDIFDVPKRSLVYKFLVNRGLRRAHLVTAASRALGEATEREVRGVTPVFLLPFGVDVNQFTPEHRIPKAGTIRIGSIKSLEPIYGIDVLVRAFAQVNHRLKSSKSDLNLELILVGQGRQRPIIESMAYSLGLRGQISFRGALPHEQIPKVLGEMDIFVAPSRFESFGVALIEASATGLPIVTTRVGGIPEVVEDGVTGLIVDPDQMEELTAALWRLVCDGELREQLGRAGRERSLREFNWHANVEGMESLYYRSCR